MKIRAARCWMEKLPLKRPYTIAYMTTSDTEIVFLELELENGLRGLGAANPFEEVVGETASDTLLHLQSGFIDGMVGRDIRDFNKIIDEANKNFPNLPGTVAAIDIAVHDAFGKFMGISVLDYYGQQIAPLETSVTIGIKGVQETLAEAMEYYKMGFRVLKVKTGLDVGEDIERVSKIREAMGEHIVLRVDANQGYSLEELKIFLDSTAGLQIEVIEQPLMAGTEMQLQLLPESVRKILVADESLCGVEDAIRLCREPKAFGVFNIKLMKCGGIRAAREIGMLAKQAGIDLFWGCNDESMVSITAALHAAMSCSNTRYLDLDGSFDLSRDLMEGGFVVKDGFLLPSGKYGLGF